MRSMKTGKSGEIVCGGTQRGRSAVCTIMPSDCGGSRLEGGHANDQFEAVDEICGRLPYYMWIASAGSLIFVKVFGLRKVKS